MTCSNLAVESSFLMQLTWKKTIIDLSKAIWEAIGVSHISSLDQKGMHLKREIHRIGYEQLNKEAVTLRTLRFLICPTGWMVLPFTKERILEGKQVWGQMILT